MAGARRTVASLPSEMSHGVRQAEHAGADHGGDIVERHVPPLGTAGRGLILTVDHLRIKKEHQLQSKL